LRMGIVMVSPVFCSKSFTNSEVLARASTEITCASSEAARTNVLLALSCSKNPSSLARGSPCAIQQFDSLACDRSWVTYSLSAWIWWHLAAARHLPRWNNMQRDRSRSAVPLRNAAFPAVA
jgi:hypothetical protein